MSTRVVVDSRPIRVTVSGAQGTAGTGGGGDFDLAALQALVLAGANITIDEFDDKLRITGDAGLPESTRHDVDGLGVSLDGIAPMDGGLTFSDVFENTFTAAEDAHIIIFDISDFTTKIWEVHELTPWVELATLVLGDWVVTTLDAPAIQSAQIARVLDAGGGLLVPITVNEQSIFNRFLTQGGHPMLPLSGAAVVGVNSSGFTGNLDGSIETVQDLADAVDALPAGAVTSVDGQTGEVDLSAVYEAAGAAATAVSSHAGASDPHTGYLRESDNLASLASASTSRSNLGLGDAATKNVGTSAGTVAEGNDSRFTDTRTPTDDSVTSAKIVNGAIVNADVNASAAIDMSKLSTTGRRVLIYDTTLGADAATVQFTGLSGYRWMVLEVNAKTTRSGSLQASLQAQFNSDTGANYTNGTSTGQSLLLIGSSLLPGTGYTAYGAAVCDIFNVAAGEKHVIGLGRALSSVAAASFGGSWNNTSNAISTIDLSSSNSANIASGSRFLLWGVV